MSKGGQAKLDGQGVSIDGDSLLVLINAEGQHSLWPSAKSVPDGWTRVSGPGSRADCMAFVETHWADMRPQSLIQSMAAKPGDRASRS